MPGGKEVTSPLLPYVNSYLVVRSAGAPEMVDGRVVAAAGAIYLVRCYLKRQDSTGTTTGADYIPTQSSPGTVLPGASGEAYLYRGYALNWVEAPEGYEILDALPTTGWEQLSPAAKPTWLIEGAGCEHVQGLEAPKACVVERCSGVYGGAAIDEIIAREIKGIPVVLRSGELTG